MTNDRFIDSSRSFLYQSVFIGMLHEVVDRGIIVACFLLENLAKFVDGSLKCQERRLLKLA